MAVWNGSWQFLYQCTFVGNSSEYGSALTVGSGSGANVDASIIWNNPGDNALAAVQWDDSGSSLDIYNSVVQGGESGMYADDLSYIYHDGILDMDPFFCDVQTEISQLMLTLKLYNTMGRAYGCTWIWL